MTRIFSKKKISDGNKIMEQKIEILNLQKQNLEIKNARKKRKIKRK